MRHFCRNILRCCLPCTGSKRSGKVLRTVVIIFNILLWFTGCAVLSVSVYLMAVHPTITLYFSTFFVLDTALISALVFGLLFLANSFVGTCAAHQKNKLLIEMTMIMTLLIVISEGMGIILVVQNKNQIVLETRYWYEKIFLMQVNNTVSEKQIQHIENALKCCGLTSYLDYKDKLEVEAAIPESCKGPPTVTAKLYTKPVHTQGCLDKVVCYVSWLLENWKIWLNVSLIMILELGGLTVEFLYLIHFFWRAKDSYVVNDIHEESWLVRRAEAISARKETARKSLSYFRKIPYPKLFRLIRKTSNDSFGIRIKFDKNRKAHVVDCVKAKSSADFAGVSTGSKIIEVNGLMAHLATSEEIDRVIAATTNDDLRILVADPETRSIYDDHKISINYKNVKGITQESLQYKPRLCEIRKDQNGFGFDLLYIEGKEGQYIEDLVPKGSGKKAGLKIGDRIVEVNGVNVDRERSGDVVKKIRMSGSIVFLLVVDSKADEYFRKKRVTMTSSLDDKYYQEKSVKNQMISSVKNHPQNVIPRYCRLERKPKEDFGLYVVVDDERVGHVIRWVDCDGAGDRAGLRIGDRFVEVNGVNVEYESDENLLKLLQQGGGAKHIIVVDKKYDCLYERSKPEYCTIHKEKNTFGFSVEYCLEKEGHYVKTVSLDGPAFRAGLKVGDRIVQLNDENMECQTHESLIECLNSCESKAVLLVINRKSNSHYKNLIDFKKYAMDDVIYGHNYTLRVPIFASKSDTYNDGSWLFDFKNTTWSDEFIKPESRSCASTSKQKSLKGKFSKKYSLRNCVMTKLDDEEYGFSPENDLYRNGETIRRVVKDGPAHLAGLKVEDRIVCINGRNVENLDHEEVVSRIRESGNILSLTVIDERSDRFGFHARTQLVQITKVISGFGFNLGYDEDGHFVRSVTGHARVAGLSYGDRVIEINGINVEDDSHIDVFNRIKAAGNTINLLTMKTKNLFHCKKYNIDLSSSLEAERDYASNSRFPSSNGILYTRSEKMQTLEISKIRKEVLLEREELSLDYGFNLACLNSFTSNEESKIGHVVHWVKKDGPADAAGLKDGDRIISVDGVNVEEEDHEQVLIRIHGNGKDGVTIVIEFDEALQFERNITMEKQNNSFGFYLWFDDNGHFVEHVIYGSSADNSGLKAGDRLIKIDENNVENETHESVVSRVNESGDIIKLTVIGVHKSDVKDIIVPKFLKIVKRDGTFGFCIQEDSLGLYVEKVEISSAAEMKGLRAGARITDINGVSSGNLSLKNAIEMIQKSMDVVELSVLFVARSHDYSRTDNLKLEHSSKNFGEETPTDMIFEQLLGKKMIDYIVERSEYSLKDFKIAKVSKNKKNILKTQNPKLSRKHSFKKKKSFLKTMERNKFAHYLKGKDNVAFGDEEENLQANCSMENHFTGQFLDATLRRGQKQMIRQRKTQERFLTSRDKINKYNNVYTNKIKQNEPLISSSFKLTSKANLPTSVQMKWNRDLLPEQ